MQEGFLHYVYKFQKFNSLNLETVNGEPIVISSVGQHNYNSGPDFFNSKLRIGNQLWAGNVEIHTKSSDWFVHGHETDPNYDNVILHIVWEYDMPVFRKDSSEIPALELKAFVEPSVLRNYESLMSNTESFINCESDFPSVSSILFNHWVDRLYFERLERKSAFIFKLLDESQNDWEAVLFKMLSKNFGLRVNGDSFFSMARSFDFSILRKIQNNPIALEALFMGQLQMLTEFEGDGYFNELKDKYEFMTKKYQLNNSGIVPVKFFRLRPPNFPTLRLSQLATLYGTTTSLFAMLIKSNSLKNLQEVFDVGTSKYWDTHFTFNKESKFSVKKLSRSFIDLLIINTVIPIKFCYLKFNGKHEFDLLLDLADGLGAEKNSITENFKAFRPIPDTSRCSQGLIQLKTEYCDKNLCLRCEIGCNLLGR